MIATFPFVVTMLPKVPFKRVPVETLKELDVMFVVSKLVIELFMKLPLETINEFDVMFVPSKLVIELFINELFETFNELVETLWWLFRTHTSRSSSSSSFR